MWQNPDTPTGAAAWAQREGIRLFGFYNGVLDSLVDVIDTASLFIPSLTSGPQLDDGSAERNRQFLASYVNIAMPERTTTGLTLDPSQINSGDLLAIHRLDGLGTMEEFGTGEHTTHIAMAMRLGEEQALFVVESTDKTNFWPNPNIQKTAWDEWIALSVACNYSIAVLPFRDDLRQYWNQSAVDDWLSYTLGYPYVR